MCRMMAAPGTESRRSVGAGALAGSNRTTPESDMAMTAPSRRISTLAYASPFVQPSVTVFAVRSTWQESWAYSDGGGNVVQRAQPPAHGDPHQRDQRG